jgi:hypothetical protein
MPTSPGQAARDPGSLLAMQRLLGNRAVQRALRRMDDPRLQRAVGGKALPAWSKRQLGRIQRYLRRLGLYRLKIDRIFGKGTESALVEAFGGDQWRKMAPGDILTRLKAAKRPAGKRGEHRIRYGEMFKDGVLDITLGIGYDEGDWHKPEIGEILLALIRRGFSFDRKKAAEILNVKAKRSLGKSAFGWFFVRENALTYKPPAGPSRAVHAVVRFVSSPSGGKGKEAAGAFLEGMTQSDVALYGGHGRYGSGPDFDRNMRYELLDRKGAVVRKIDNYEVLHKILRREGRRRRPKYSSWSQFKWRVRRNRIRVIGSNEGNLFLNAKNRHAREFGAKLMYWNLKRAGGSKPVTGRKGKLAAAAEQNPERKYRLWVFNGCRTQDYVKSIRKTPKHGAHTTDIIASRRSLYWSDIAETLIAFLDSLLKQQSAGQIIREMDAKQDTEGRKVRSFRGFGFRDNPINR